MEVHSRTKAAIAAALATLLVTAGAGAKDYSDPMPLEYRVVDLEERGEDSIKINAEVEKVVEYSSVMKEVDRDGRKLYCLAREERTAAGDVISWKLFLLPDTLDLTRIEKKTVSRSGKTVREQWTDYDDPMFSFPRSSATSIPSPPSSGPWTSRPAPAPTSTCSSPKTPRPGTCSWWSRPRKR